VIQCKGPDYREPYRLADKPGVGPEKKNLERGHGAVSIIHELQSVL